MKQTSHALVPHQTLAAGHNDIASVPAAVVQHSAVSENANVNARAASLDRVLAAAA